MGAIRMRDVSSAGHELGRAHLDDLPPVLSVGELLRARIEADVVRYNRAPGVVFAGLVQPADAIRHSDGHHLPTPRPLDADRLVLAAEQAVAAGILSLLIDGEVVDDLAHELEVDHHDEVLAVLRRPVVTRA